MAVAVRCDGSAIEVNCCAVAAATATDVLAARVQPLSDG